MQPGLSEFEPAVLNNLDAAHNLARWLMRNDADAQDVVQESCMKALRRNNHLINVFIRPGQGTPEHQSRQGFNLIRFECNGMICWAVSDLNAGELQQFVDLFKAQGPTSNHS